MDDDAYNEPLYMISVAAKLAGVHPQTLRSYEQKGLVSPQRTSGNTRMYSKADIDRLELINEQPGRRDSHPRPAGTDRGSRSRAR